jgi:uncharacterized repeat protein (TIGR01451 family)
MFRFFTRFLVGFLLISCQAMAQSFTINAPLIADGGICTAYDTASFSATITINNYQNQTWYMDFDFGDGGSDTFAFVTDNVNGTYIFHGSHEYQSNGTYQVKVYARDYTNVIRDSIISSVTIGNCQKASGTVYHDYLENCTRDPAETGMANQYYKFYNNGVLQLVYLDAEGRFKIPVYAGDTIVPQSGSISFANTYALPCNSSAFSPITGAVSDYWIALKPMVTSHMLTYFCPDADTMVCAGGYVYMPFGIVANDNWYIRMDFGDGQVYAPNEYYTGIPDQSHTYYTPGLHTAKVMLYNQNHYGPVMMMQKTFSVMACHPVKVDIYSDNNNNCQVDSGEYHYDMNQGYGMQMHSVLRNGNNPYSQNPDGSINALIWPGDTVYRAPTLSYFSGDPANLHFTDIPDKDCNPGYITDAIDSTAFAYESKIKITDRAWYNSGNCVGDTLFFSVTAASTGIMPGNPLRLRCLYSDGITDTVNLVSLSDTLSVSFIRNQIVPGQLSFIFILEKADGTVADTAYGYTQVNNCALVKVKVYNDKNRNCVKDSNEVNLTHFSVENTGWVTSTVLDSTTLRLVVSPGNMLQKVLLGAGSSLGQGYYAREYTSPFCSWPVYTADTATYEVPLVDTIRVQNASLLNFISASSEVPHILACDSVYHPVLRGSIYGNRNAAYPPYFVYNNGNNVADTAIVTPIDNYLDVSSLYKATAPNTTYTYGSYVPGYGVWNGNHNKIYQYTHNPALQVTHNCETPKAKLFIDLNANCTKEAADPALGSIAVAVTINGQTMNVVTDNSGNVFFNAANGSLVTITVPQTLSTGQGLSSGCVTGNTLSYTYTSGSATNNFPYSCGGTANDYSILAGHDLWLAGATDTIYLYPQHTGCGNGSAVLSLVLDPALSFVASSRPGHQISGQTLSWNIANIISLGTAPVKVRVSVNATVPAGSNLCNTASLLPVVPDANPGNNVFVLCDSIFGTPQPLFKTGLSDSIYFQPGQPVIYTIHFQNTTPSPVTQVVVLDTISPLLNINSLSVLNASHVYNTVVLNNNVLKFTFPNIQLQPGSSGMIQFSLNAVGSLTPGTVITNRAAVAYNYQSPVLTNMAMSAGIPPIPLQSGLKDISAVNVAAVNIIDWIMADGTAGSYFELGKSNDGKTFRYLAAIPGREHITAYQYKDTDPLEGLNFYRLKMLGMDGRFSYSPVVSAIWNKKENFGIYAYPNPARQIVSLKIAGNMGSSPVVVISDLGGRQLARILPGSNEILVDMSRWANGVYLVHYTDAVHNQTIKITKE